mgnify:CR=1 FL=1
MLFYHVSSLYICEGLILILMGTSFGHKVHGIDALVSLYNGVRVIIFNSYNLHVLHMLITKL